MRERSNLEESIPSSETPQIIPISDEQKQSRYEAAASISSSWSPEVIYPQKIIIFHSETRP